MPVSLVTGGAGFIGSHLVELLLSEGHEVRVVDNLSTGRLDNLSSLDSEPRLRFENIDLGSRSASAALDSMLAGCDHVFHLAALADIVPSIQRPMEYHRANVDGTAHLLDAVIRVTESGALALKRFVYAASSSCYGIPDDYPTPETADIRPLYPYALTKRLAEELVLHWVEVYGLPAVSLRLFNVYGPRSRTSGTYGAVFGVFLRQKLAGAPFTVVGDGGQSRDFTYVSDIARGMLAAVTVPLQAVRGECINLGSGGHQSINRLVELLEGDVVHIPKRPGEPDITFADTTKATDLLGWKAEVEFEQGVRTMLDNIDYWADAPLWTPDSIEEATRDWFVHLSVDD